MDNLTLQYSIEEQAPYKDTSLSIIYNKVNEYLCDSSFCSYQIKEGNRIKIKIERPYTQNGNIKIAAIDPNKSIKKSFISNDGPLSLEFEYDLKGSDSGNWFIRRQVEGSDIISYAMLNIRVYNEYLENTDILIYDGDNHEIKSGTEVKSGFWIFASGLVGVSDFMFISLCVVDPKNKISCSGDNKIKIKVDDKGKYTFISYDKNQKRSEKYIIAK